MGIPAAELIVPLFIFVILVLMLVTCSARPFMRSLRNKHFFITGGSTGIGLAIANKALLHGAVVTLVSRNTANLTKASERLVREVQCSPEAIRCEAADVGDYDAISAALKRASNWKPIDVLICNAGLTRGGYLDTASVEDLELTVRTNVMGTVNVLHAALPDMKNRSFSHPCSIVMMGSLASLFLMYGHSVYTATKYALRGLAEGLRFELIPYNIKVSLVCPGFTSTAFLDDADKEQETCELLKRVNLYNRKYAESPDSVAWHTMKAIRKGAFLVTTGPLGFVLATLGRGFVPSRSFAEALLEVIFFFPFRVASAICVCDFRWAILRRRRKATKTLQEYAVAVGRNKPEGEVSVEAI